MENKVNMRLKMVDTVKANQLHRRTLNKMLEMGIPVGEREEYDKILHELTINTYGKVDIFNEPTVFIRRR